MIRDSQNPEIIRTGWRWRSESLYELYDRVERFRAEALRKPGRPRAYASNAERQAAYRARKAAARE